VGPAAPAAPVAPVTPVGPVGPVAPVAPVAPVGPVAPPPAPVTSTIKINYGNSSFGINPQTVSYAVDTTNFVYPSSYTTKASINQINTDPCDLDITVVTYPVEYIGSFPLPEVIGAPLRSSIIRGITLTDSWGRNNPTWTDGCKGDIRKEYLKTLDRIKRLGAQWVTFIPWTLIKQRQDGSWYIMSPEENKLMPDDDLEFAVNAAKAAGLKVAWRNQIQGLNTPSHIFVPPSTEENLVKFILAYKQYMLDRASTLEKLKVDAMDIDCTHCWTANFNNDTQQRLWLPALADVAKTTKSVFSGKLSIFDTDTLELRKDILDYIDIISVYFMMPTLSNSELENLNVNLYRNKLSHDKNRIKMLSNLGKTISLNFSVDSRQRALTDQRFLEGSHCTSTASFTNSAGFVVIDPVNCLQRSTPTDFSVQAIGYEAILEEISLLNLSVPTMVFAWSYLYTDFVMPSSAFPNLTGSPRNKPAEGILKKWFSN
jgi:hypothetical protein